MSGIYLNEDCNHFIYSRHKMGVKVDETVLRDFISQYKNTQVTDFVINPNGMISFAPSKVRQTALEKFMEYKKQGNLDDSNAYAQILYDVYIEQGLDIYAIWFDQCRKDSITPWLSVRPNDCHCNFMDDHLLLSDFFKEKKHLRRVTHREYDGYFDNCLDYNQEESRQYLLDYIEECLDSYDFDGLEIDWSREFYCFKLGYEKNGIAILNEFMKTIKRMVDKYATKHNHPIKIGVRVPYSPITSLKLGFDAMTWIKEGFIDVIVPSPRWATTDTDMSIDFWKRLVDGTTVELAAGMDINLKASPDSPMKHQTIETAAGNAIMNLSNGAKKTYLFNFMDRPAGSDDETILHDDMQHHNHPANPQNYPTLLNQFGCIETLLDLPRRHVVSYHDVEAPGTPRAAILPIKVEEKNKYHCVRIETGIIPADKTITLIIAATPDNDKQELTAEDFAVYVNSADTKYAGTITPQLAYSESPHYAFSVKNTGDIPPASVAEFATLRNPYTVDYVELRVE